MVALLVTVFSVNRLKSYLEVRWELVCSCSTLFCVAFFLFFFLDSIYSEVLSLKIAWDELHNFLFL
jgi:hypothetical protein